MRRKGERRKRSAKCPECGEFFSPQGLNGHLRFTHGLRGEAMKQQLAAGVVAGGVVERAHHTRELIGELETIRQKLNELRPQRRTGNDWTGYTTDGAISDACDALEARELEVRNEIRKLEGKPPLVLKLVTKPGFFSSSESLELVEQQPDAPPATDGES